MCDAMIATEIFASPGPDVTYMFMPSKPAPKPVTRRRQERNISVDVLESLDYFGALTNVIYPSYISNMIYVRWKRVEKKFNER